MANDTLETVAGKINALTEKMGKATKDARAYRATRDELMVEAHRRIVVEKEIDTPFATWCAEKITLSAGSARNLISKLTGGTNSHAVAGNKYDQQNAVESEEEALAETRKEIAEQAKAPVHHEANQARRIVEAMGFDNLRVFDAWYMPHRAALIGPTDEVLASRAEVASLKLEVTNLKLASETQSPLPTPKLRKERVREDPSPDEEAATKLWLAYSDMPSKSVWLMQRFNDIKAGLPLDLKGQGDASFQVVRDYEAANEAVRALFDTKLKTQQSDKKHKGDDF
jgi:Spy/CpxP family protein refolding chaperone